MINSLLFVFGCSLMLTVLLLFSMRGQFIRWGLFGIDINKKDKPKIAEGVGILLFLSVAASLGIFTPNMDYATIIVLTTALFFTLLGFIDDLKDLSLKKRIISAIILPLAFAYYLYPSDPLLFILAVIYVAGSTSFVNTFAGLNGWEVGSSMIIVGLLAAVTQDAILIALFGAVVALFIFNRYPASIMPGDSTTFFIGSLIGMTLLRYDMGLIGIALFIPHIIDIMVKIMSNREDLSQKKTQPYILGLDGNIYIPKNKLDFAKLIVKLFGPMNEKKIVFLIWVFVGLNTIVWLFFFRI